MKEIWKTIHHFDRYEISNLGNIRKFLKAYKKYKKLSPFTSQKGYLLIDLSINNKKTKKRWQMHRLVATYFIPNPENKPQINHKNGIKTDNSILNLEWVTNKENRDHAESLGLFNKAHENRRGEKNNTAKLSVKDVRNIKYKLAKTMSQGQIAKKYKVTQACISLILKEKNWKHV